MLVRVFLPANNNLTVINKKDTNVFYIYNSFFFYKLSFKKIGHQGGVEEGTNSICVCMPAINNYNYYLSKLTKLLFS